MNWSKNELQELDRKTRKLMTLFIQSAMLIDYIYSEGEDERFDWM